MLDHIFDRIFKGGALDTLLQVRVYTAATGVLAYILYRLSNYPSKQ